MIVQKLIQRSKWVARDLSHSLGFSTLPAVEAGLRILIYHGIDLDGSTQFNTRFISKEYFEKQIAYFSKHFNLVSLDDVFSNQLKTDKLNIAITFDDGYLNNLKYAVPILEKYNAPATFFITGIRDAGLDVLWPDVVDMATAKLHKEVTICGELFRKNRKGELTNGSMRLKEVAKLKPWSYKVKMMEDLEAAAPFRNDQTLSDYWQQLSIEQIRELAASPIATIGSHGYYHNNLGGIEFNDAVDELKNSKSFLENTIQQEVHSIAFPDGSYSREIVDAAEMAGYTQQLAVEYLFGEDQADSRVLDRFGVNPFISWNNQLHCLMKNSYW